MMGNFFGRLRRRERGKSRGISLIELMAAAGIALVFLVSFSDLNSLLLKMPLKATDKFIAARMSRNFLTFAAREQNNSPELLLMLHWQKSFAAIGLRPELFREQHGNGRWLILKLWRDKALFHQSGLLLPGSDAGGSSGGRQ